MDIFMLDKSSSAYHHHKKCSEKTLIVVVGEGFLFAGFVLFFHSFFKPSHVIKYIETYFVCVDFFLEWYFVCWFLFGMILLFTD